MADEREVGEALRLGRRERPPGVGILAALEGAALILLNLLATPFIGAWRRRWGTVGTEASDAMPGDELVPEPKWSYTMGIGVDASPEDVWPWIAQLGQGRGGFYTYQALENMVGCSIRNTTEVQSVHQHPAVGGAIHLHPESPPLRIEVVEPPHAFVLFGSPAEIGSGSVWGTSTWQFIVLPAPGGGSRFLTRGRYDHSRDWKGRLMFGRILIEPVSFVMSRKMMIEIKRLAEGRSL